MGNYVTTGDIITKNGLTNTQVDKIINAWEEAIEWYCADIFYEWEDYLFYFRGNDKVTMFSDILVPYDLCSISSIYSVDFNGNEALVDADYYQFTEYSITRLQGTWIRSRRMKYKVTCSLGNKATDADGNENKRYKPDGLQHAIVTLVTREINEVFGTTASGTTVPDGDKLEGFNFQSEERFDYAYKRKWDSTGLTDRNNPTPTGIPSIDFILRSLQRKKMKWFSTDRNINRYGNLSESAEITGA